MAYLSDPVLPGQDVGTIVTLALENLKPTLIDNLSKPIPGYEWLVSNGRVQYEDGGYQIRFPIMWDDNNTISSYLPGDPFNMERPSGFISAKYGWAFVGGGFLLDGPTEFMTGGKYGVVNMTQTFIDQLKISFAQAMSTMLYSDGTGNNGADLLGLDILLEDATSTWSTLGGLDPDTYTFWKNGYEDYSSTAFGVSNGCNAEALIKLRHYIKVHNKPGVGKVDMILTCLDQYEMFERAMHTKGSIDLPSTYTTKYYDLGWGGLRVDGVTVLYDQNLDGHATMDNSWFGLNSKCLKFVIGKNKAFEVTGPIEHPLMDAKLWKAKMYGQLCVMNRRDAMFRIKMSASA